MNYWFTQFGDPPVTTYETQNISSKAEKFTDLINKGLSTPLIRAFEQFLIRVMRFDMRNNVPLL